MYIVHCVHTVDDWAERLHTLNSDTDTGGRGTSWSVGRQNTHVYSQQVCLRPTSNRMAEALTVLAGFRCHMSWVQSPAESKQRPIKFMLVTTLTLTLGINKIRL